MRSRQHGLGKERCHESNAVEAREEAERLRGELAKAKLELEEAKLRLSSPSAAGKAPGPSWQKTAMDTSCVESVAVQASSQMGNKAVGAGIPMTPMRGPPS